MGKWKKFSFSHSARRSCYYYLAIVIKERKKKKKDKAVKLHESLYTGLLAAARDKRLHVCCMDQFSCRTVVAVAVRVSITFVAVCHRAGNSGNHPARAEQHQHNCDCDKGGNKIPLPPIQPKASAAPGVLVEESVGVVYVHTPCPVSQAPKVAAASTQTGSRRR